VYEGLEIRKYEWSMAAFNYPRTPGGDSVYAVPYNEVWYFNIDSLCYHMATNRNSRYTKSLVHYHLWEITNYTSEKQLEEIYDKMKAAAKKYNYPSLSEEADYRKIQMQLFSTLTSKGNITNEEMDNVLGKIQEHNKRFKPNDKVRALVSLCDSYRISRLTDHNDLAFLYVPIILKLLEQVSFEDNPDYYYLYFFIGNDYYRFGDKEQGVYYLKKALHDDPVRFSDRSDLRARVALAEYFVGKNMLDSSDYYYRSLYDSPQMVRFRPIYDAVAAGGIAYNLVRRGDYDKALPLLERWLPEARRMRVVRVQFNMYVAAGWCYLANKQYERAKAMTDSLRSLAEPARNIDIIEEVIPKNNLSTENIYGLLSDYHLLTGNTVLARQYLDSMRTEETRRRETQTPLTILHAEHKAYNDEKELINHLAETYKTNNHRLLVILGIALALLSLIAYLYKKQREAYHKLVKSREWAKQRTLETVATAEELDIVHRAHELMNDGLFRDSELTLQSFATKLSIHRNVLSRAVNRVTDKRFNLFVNEYRIKEAIRMIENAPRGNKNLYIDGLYEELGFSNPASFFRVFKQITGLPPGAFFRQAGNDAK
jgi:AraC-like DNA-binding protein